MVLLTQIFREVLQNDAILLAYDDATHYKHNQESKPHHDELRVNNPDEYYQGDVDLTKWQALKLQTQILDSLGDESTTKRHKRKIGKRWDKRKPIIYDFADSIPAETRDKIKQALNIWQKGTCLRFKEGGPDVDRLEFFDGGGCSSFVGKTGGTQGISISTPGCDQVGIIAHEIGHALALFHEQARPDQLENIAIHYQNIPVSRWNNFHPVTDNQAATFGLPYDTGSVMHYGAYGFSSDPYRPTISTIDRNFQTTIGQRTEPSFLDIQSINEAYKCRENCKNSLSCLHGGYPHPNNCYTCLCPAGFQGQFCELVVTNTLCGGIITASTTPTHIQTPNYPNPFPHGQACIWLLQAPPTGHLFLQFIDNFHYQCEDTCDKSFVEVKTGPDFRPTGYRFCCSVVPSQVFQSGEQEMLIMHFANDQVSTGFRAKVWTDKEVVQPHLPSTAMPTTTDELTTPSTTTIFYLTPTTTILPVWPFTLFGTSSISPFTLPGEATTLSPFTTPGAGILTALVTSSAGSSITDQKCICQGWTEWSACSQMCGGCGKRSRKRECASVENCQVEEKRTCNFQACPQGTNFLFNNSEFHILWKSCCVGLFRSKDQCTALENGENAFLR
uniref:Zinc metalloproteinase n=1 Tax=Ditylenchus dipsaci TaxID=166011 RepID=A0A915DDV3_9BILA